jgi:hypothetical protein
MLAVLPYIPEQDFCLYVLNDTVWSDGQTARGGKKIPGILCRKRPGSIGKN